MSTKKSLFSLEVICVLLKIRYYQNILFPIDSTHIVLRDSNNSYETLGTLLTYFALFVFKSTTQITHVLRNTEWCYVTLCLNLH
jgi:hypothetical protein